MAETVADTIEGDVELVLVIDPDDEHTYENVAWPIPTVKLVTGEREWPPVKWNLGVSAAQGDILFLGQDDVAFRTNGWDTTIEDTYANLSDPYWLVYTRNGHQDQRLATYPFLTRPWIDTLGYMVWDAVVGDFCETWVFDIAKQVGRTRYLPDVLIEHLHPAFGKADEDQTHREYRAAQQGSRAWRKYQTTATQRATDADKIRSRIEE